MTDEQRISDGKENHARRGRRNFLRQVGAGSLIAAAAWSADASGSNAEAAETPASPRPAPLPTIRLGDRTVTRLIAGGNPVQGYSHSSELLSRHMKEYFTAERVADFLIHCEKAGINTFQVSHSETVRDGLRLAWERGSKIQWICLTSEAPHHPPLEDVLALKPFAIVHHGGVTDRYFRDGTPDKAHDFVKKIHDKGLLAGVSSHVPANIQTVEERGWENDFFMNCFYNVVRTPEQIKQELGGIPLGTLFLTDDPKAMTKVIRQSRKPCLGFKILAAGRLCRNSKSVENAFRFALRNIKTTDGVIVGMYPRFNDEPRENVSFTVKYGGNA